MKLLVQSLLIGTLVFLSNCEFDSSSSQGGSTESVKVDSLDASPENYNNRGITRYVAPQHGCSLVGNILPENQLWLEESDILFIIKADSTTYDEELETDSHRVLEVYNTENCERIKRDILPINESPDFPYYLAKITYNHGSKLVAIRGFRTIHIYDLAENKLIPTIEPDFSDDVFAVDAQSGRILRLELWENYVIGFAQDFGAFAMNLENIDNPKAILPFAQWKDEQERPHSLFLLPSESGGQQAIVPSYDAGKATFSVNPIFDQPQEINTTQAAGTKGSQFVVFRGKNGSNGQGIAINLKANQLVELPQNIAQGKNDAILNWLKANKK